MLYTNYTKEILGSKMQVIQTSNHLRNVQIHTDHGSDRYPTASTPDIQTDLQRVATTKSRFSNEMLSDQRNSKCSETVYLPCSPEAKITSVFRFAPYRCDFD